MGDGGIYADILNNPEGFINQYYKAVEESEHDREIRQQCWNDLLNKLRIIYVKESKKEKIAYAKLLQEDLISLRKQWGLKTQQVKIKEKQEKLK
jgi:hypothetical protein